LELEGGIDNFTENEDGSSVDLHDLDTDFQGLIYGDTIVSNNSFEFKSDSHTELSNLRSANSY
jgi:hypothetical protein